MTAFSAMTWNVENLFRPEAGATEDERRSYEGKLGLLAGVIGRLDPDAVALQEVGGDGPLEDLQGAPSGAYPHRAVSAFPDGGGIRVAFLSGHPIEESEDVVEFPEGPALDVHDLTADGGTRPIDRMGRGALRVRVAKEGLSVDLISCHLKSKPFSFPRPWGRASRPATRGARSGGRGRADEARGRGGDGAHLGQRAPRGGLGDLNDVPEAQTSLVLNGPPGSEIGTLGFARPDDGDDTRLFNLAPLIPQERRFSRVERGRAELLDQILASVECFPAGEDGKRRLPEADAHVDFRERLPSVTDDPSERKDDVAPDHAP